MIAILGLLLAVAHAEDDGCVGLGEAICSHDFWCLWDGNTCYLDELAYIYEDGTESSYQDALTRCPNPVQDPTTDPGCYIEKYEFSTGEFYYVIYTTPTGSDYCSLDSYVVDGFCDPDNCDKDVDGFCFDYCTLHPGDSDCFCILYPDDDSCVPSCTDEYATGCICANNPWGNGCYPNKENAGICEGRSVSGCSGIPFCHYNKTCEPDWKCYYSFENYLSPAYINGACNETYSSDGGPGCKSKRIGEETYCTTDTITSAREKCILAGGGRDKDKCEAAGCEWIAPGSTSSGRQYDGWCAEIGSGAFVVHMSSVTMMVLLSVMLTLL